MYFCKLTVQLCKLHVNIQLFLCSLLQDWLQKSNATDASGNPVLSDIGVHIQQKVRFLIYFSLFLQLYDYSA
jgi:hypothetical protein